MTVKSYAMTHTWRPSTSPCPVTTPSAGALSEPSRSFASKPSSTNVPGSNSRSMRSRTVSLPRWCCFSIFSAPPMAGFFLRLAWRSPTFDAYSSPIARILLADQEVFPVPPSIEEAVHVAFREPFAFVRLGRLPQPVLVLFDGQAGQGDGATAAIAQPEAELDVGH